MTPTRATGAGLLGSRRHRRRDDRETTRGRLLAALATACLCAGVVTADASAAVADLTQKPGSARCLSACDVGARMTAAVVDRCAGHEPAPIANADADAVCANTCPDSPGRRHDRRPDGRRLF